MVLILFLVFLFMMFIYLISEVIGSCYFNCGWEVEDNLFFFVIVCLNIFMFIKLSFFYCFIYFDSVWCFCLRECFRRVFIVEISIM